MGWYSDFDEGKVLVRSGLIPELGGEGNCRAECGVKIHNTQPTGRLTLSPVL